MWVKLETGDAKKLIIFKKKGVVKSIKNDEKLDGFMWW